MTAVKKTPPKPSQAPKNQSTFTNRAADKAEARKQELDAAEATLKAYWQKVSTSMPPEVARANVLLEDAEKQENIRIGSLVKQRIEDMTNQEVGELSLHFTAPVWGFMERTVETNTVH